MSRELKYKIILLGDFYVGKTSLIKKYVYNIFSDKYLTTIGVNISKKQLILEQNEEINNVTLILWDINGDEGFIKISPQYLHGSNAAILVADLSRPPTIDNIKKHIDFFKEQNKDAPLILALNKYDLYNNRENELSDLIIKVRNIISKYNIDFLFTSAKDGSNVNEIFLRISNLILMKSFK